ncbi:unnamed protein product [Lepeophtheirus salmonis]|uniref:(salmon louse) hypothetical protein n=1 Tax=Lepeophtheirus salmonis TaxID=72036 RepID=A0A817FF77_LEPSM|nr:unnamed protein product [Lepeophtheirus salmonis]CAG9478367.1 unnamed protein product [Lepeophtheirus salmonis]
MSAKEIAEIVVPSSVLSSNELVNLFVNKAVIVPEVKLKSPSWRAQSFCLYSSKSEFAYCDSGSLSSSFTFEVTSSVVMSGLTILGLQSLNNVDITVQKNSLVWGTSSSVVTKVYTIIYQGLNSYKCSKTSSTRGREREYLAALNRQIDQLYANRKRIYIQEL